MKTPVLIALFAGLACIPAFSADKAAELIAQGKQAEQDGNVAAAKAAYTSALQVDPANPNARYALGQLNQNSGAVAARSRAKMLSQITIPAIDFDNVTLSEGLEALAVMTEKASGDKKFAANFMVQDPAGKLSGKTLTLKLKGVPTSAVLQMMMDQVGAKVKYEEHAVVIKPAGSP